MQKVVDLNSRPTGMLAKAGVGLTVLFVACCVGMHFVQPDLNPVDDAVSYYMNGLLGWVLGLGLVALGVGSLLLAGSLYLAIGPAKARFGLFLLALWGAGAVIGGVFPPDPRGHWDRPPSLPGMLHAGAAMVAFVALPPASLLLSRRLTALPAVFGAARDLRWLAGLNAASLGVFFVCLAPVFSNRPPYVLGLIERVLLASYVAWLLATGLRILHAAKRTQPVNQAP